MEFVCIKPEELDAIASTMLEYHSEARIFAFFGKLGAGKTTFIKSLCSKLKVLDTAVSPSFGIINEYITFENTKIFHFDFYRIKNISEFLDLGCEEYFFSGSYCFIEWPEKIYDFLPDDYVTVNIEEINGKRFIKF